MLSRKIYFVVEYTVVFILVVLVIDFSGIAKHVLELNFDSEFHYPMHGKVLRYAHQLRLNKVVKISPINKYNYSFLYNCAQKCLKSLTPSAVGVTILVKSAMDHFERRVTIRKTWGSEYKRKNTIVRSVFLLGNSKDKVLAKLVQNESNQYGDIVMADFVDSYYNNTIKTMIGFRWVVEYCPDSTYYLFVDDDYFISIKNVLRFIKDPLTYPNDILDLPQLQENTIGLNSKFGPENFQNTIAFTEQSLIHVKFYAGFVLNSSPHRHKLSKWYIPLSEYPFDMWPPYVTAGAYILSKEALFEMYFVSMYTEHFRFDDIYLSILALKANINTTHCPAFYFQKAKYLDPESYRNVIASHGYGDPTKLFNTWMECYTAGYA